jgi:hypothetical protein
LRFRCVRSALPSSGFGLCSMVTMATKLFALGLCREVSREAQSGPCLATSWTTGRSRFDTRQRRKDFSSSLCVQTGSGAHPASCTMGTGGPFLGAKARPGRDADHSPPSSAEVVNE